MNKGDLIQAVAAQAGFSKKDANKAIDAVLHVIRAALSKGERVSLVGFGTFEVRHRRARTGRNPRTGKSLNIKAHRVAVFRAGKPLRESINE